MIDYLLGNPILAWIGATCFAFSALPQVIKCVQEKNAHGVSWGLLGLWMGGEICLFLYILPEQKWALLVNYIFNIIFISIIIYYKLYPKESLHDIGERIERNPFNKRRTASK